MPNQVFRLFVSSTFSDFQREREALQARVFPELERYCLVRGARFQAVDLRWGISEEAGRQHSTMKVCLDEIRRAQRLSPRPNFVVLLGDRYGWEPPVAEIPDPEWKRMWKVAGAADRKLLEGCYRKDANALPATWLLTAAGKDLLPALRRAAGAADIQGFARVKYFASATHQEIELGVMQVPDAAGHVHVYARRIEGLPFDDSARLFCDWPDTDARERLRALERQLKAILPEERFFAFTAAWDGSDIDSGHIDAFCEAFLRDQKRLIDRELAAMSIEPDDPEAGQWGYARQRTSIFVGRRQVRQEIARYVRPGKAAKAPLVVHGPGGTGKSFILARAALDAAAQKAPPVILLRFIGGVAGNETLTQLLDGLMRRIASAYGQQAQAWQNTEELVAEFHGTLALATARKRLTLFIDAVDQLDGDDDAWDLEWLPAELPPHVRFVISTRGGETLAAARRRFPESLLAVAPMPANEGRQLLRALLAEAGRKLTGGQRDALLSRFAEAGSPLWLKLAYEEARSWHSWDAGRELPSDIPQLIRQRIAELARAENHGSRFVWQSLAFLAAGRYGLAEQELAEALAAEPDVRAEFLDRARNPWPHRHLPPILWSRLFFDIEHYLKETLRDGVYTYQFFHREFQEVLERDALSGDDGKRTHAALAEVFSEPSGDDLFRRTDVTNPGQQDSRAMRRVAEQPWQLAKAGDGERLGSLLTDFGFLMAKAAAGRCEDLTRDCQTAKPLLVAASQEVRECIRYLIAHANYFSEPDRAAWRVMFQLAMDHADNSPLTKAAEAFQAAGSCDWQWLRLMNRPKAWTQTPLLAAFERKGLTCLVGPDVNGFLLAASQSAIEAIDPKTGRPVWITRLSGAVSCLAVQPFTNLCVAAVNETRKLLFIDSTNGVVLRAQSLASEAGSLGFVCGHVVAILKNQSLIGIAPEGGEAYELLPPWIDVKYGSSAFSRLDTHIYFYDHQNELVRFSGEYSAPPERVPSDYPTDRLTIKWENSGIWFHGLESEKSVAAAVAEGAIRHFALAGSAVTDIVLSGGRSIVLRLHDGRVCTTSIDAPHIRGRWVPVPGDFLHAALDPGQSTLKVWCKRHVALGASKHSLLVYDLSNGAKVGRRTVRHNRSLTLETNGDATGFRSEEPSTFPYRGRFIPLLTEGVSSRLRLGRGEVIRHQRVWNETKRRFAFVQSDLDYVGEYLTESRSIHMTPSWWDLMRAPEALPQSDFHQLAKWRADHFIESIAYVGELLVASSQQSDVLIADRNTGTLRRIYKFEWLGQCSAGACQEL